MQGYILEMLLNSVKRPISIFHNFSISTKAPYMKQWFFPRLKLNVKCQISRFVIKPSFTFLSLNSSFFFFFVILN